MTRVPRKRRLVVESSEAEEDSPPKKLSRNNRSIRSFFTAPPSSSLQPPTASQHEDLDDLIEDAFSDDDPHLSSAVGKASTRQVFAGIGRNRVELRVPTPLKPSIVKTVAIDPRPWPERFAPKSSVDLAVNPKKVSEVRSWLEHVLDGFSKQRLLVLKGSAGTGKTATINALSDELGFEVMEWKNPGSAIREDNYGEEGAFCTGLAGVFEEFIARVSKFGSLQMISTADSPTAARTTIKCSSSDAGEVKKIILIEDFPNALFMSSPAPLASFRRTIKSYLAIPPPPRNAPTVPPLVLIISESATVTGPGAFTAHRLLSPEILHHPLAASITYNKIAPTFMLKALSAVITKESRESGRKFGPSKPLMEALTTSGDVRSAIMGLEFLAVNGELGAFSERLITTANKKKKLREGELNKVERDMLLGVTQRESSFGIFHAIGKVVHNKRYGDDLEDPYVAPSPKPPLEIHPWKSRASRVDVNCLIDEAGTDAQTLISGLHENYLGSCNFLGGFSRHSHSLEDLLDCVNDCIGDLSDSDLLASPRLYHNTLGARAGANYEGSGGSIGTAGISQDEISFHVAVRGLMMALPSPVKRDARDNKMFYPTDLKLWRAREEIQSFVDHLIGKFRSSQVEHMSGSGVFGVGRAEMVLERLPYLGSIMKGHQHKASGRSSYGMKLFNMAGMTGSQFMKELEKVTLLRGIGGPSEGLPDGLIEEQAVPDELEAAEERRKGLAPVSGKDGAISKSEKKRKENTMTEDLELINVESLVLADDEIEDDW